MEYIFLIIISIFFGLILRFIAIKRGARPTFWFVMGFVFGPLSLPFVFFARKDQDFKPNNIN